MPGISVDLGIGLSLGTIVGFAIKTIVGDKLARDRALEVITINELNKATVAFRAAFVDEIYLLRRNISSGNTDVYKIITDNMFISHEKAKILFEPFIPDKLKAFNIAWDEYSNCHHEYYSELVRDETGTRAKTPYNPCSPEQRKELSDKYLSHINKLFVFAQPRPTHNQPLHIDR